MYSFFQHASHPNPLYTHIKLITLIRFPASRNIIDPRKERLGERFYKQANCYHNKRRYK